MTKNIENKYCDNLKTVISQKNDIYSNSKIYQVATKASAMISPNLYNFIFMTFKDTLELSRNSPIRKLKNNNIQNDNDNELKKNRKRKHSSSSGGSKEVDELNIKEKEIENIKAASSCSEIQESTEKCISKKARRKEIYESKTNISNDKVLKDKDKIEDGGESEEDRVNNDTCFGNLVNSDPLKKGYKKRKHEEIAQLEQKSTENQFSQRQSDNKSPEKEFAESNSTKSVSADLSILEENAEAEELALKECWKNKSKNKLKKHDGKDKLDEALQNNQSSDKEKMTVNRIYEKEEQFEKRNKQESVCDISTEQRGRSEETMNEELEANSVSLKENCSDILQISEKKSMSIHFSILSEESEESGDNPEKRIEEEKKALNASEALPLDFPDFCETLNKYIEKTHARSYEESNFDKVDEMNVNSLRIKDRQLSSTVYEERCKVFKQKNNGTFKKDKQEKSEVNEDDHFDKPGRVGATRSSGSDDLCENNRSLYSKEDNGDVFNKEKKKASSETRASEDEETLTLKENPKQVVNVINNEILISPSLQLLPRSRLKKFDEEIRNNDNNFNHSNEEEEIIAINTSANDRKEDSKICESNKTLGVLTQFDTDMTTDKQIKKKAKSEKVRKRRSSGSDDLRENNRSLYSKEDKGDVFNKKKKKASSETRASDDEETVILKKNSKQVVNVISNEILSPSLQVLPKKQIEKHKKFDEEIRNNKDNNFNQSNEEEEIFSINNIVNDGKEDSEICESNKTPRDLTQFDTDMTTDKQIKKKCNLSQKNITEFFKRKKDDVNEISHFNIESQSSSWKNDEAGKEHNTTTVKKDEKLRKKLIKAVTNKIEKVLLKNKPNDSSYGVEVVVSVKKDAKQTGTNEELLVSYKKCALEEVTNVTMEEKEEELSGSKSFDDEKQQETVEEEKYEDDDWLTEKLASLRIHLPWSVPKIHQIETTLTGGPSKHQRRQIAVSGVKLKRGPYTSSEDQIIRNNWDDFCEKHDLPLDSHSFFRSSHFQNIDRLSNEQKLNFVRFLAHGLSDRTLYSVYSRFQKLFLNDRRKCGRFSSEEDKIIMAYMKNHVNDKKPYCQLAAILNRDKTAVFKRHRRLVDNDKGKVKKVRWNRQNVDKFLKHLINVTTCKNIEELKERQITTEEWEQISKMINLSVKQLQQFWFIRVYPRLFIEKDMDDHEILNKLLNILTDNNYNDWRNVNWKEISKEFDGCTSQYLYQMFKGTVVRHRVPEEKQHNLRECVEYLRNNYWKFRKYKKRINLNLDESILQGDIQCDTSESSEEDSE